jgi:hypothetical protein
VPRGVSFVGAREGRRLEDRTTAISSAPRSARFVEIRGYYAHKAACGVHSAAPMHLVEVMCSG